VVKVSAAYVFAFGLEGGAFLSAGSGWPVNELAAGSLNGTWTPTFQVPRGTAGRTPTLWNVDLRLAYTLTLGRGPRSRIVLDVLHLGNPRRATRVDEMHYTSLDQNGNPVSPNSQYKQPMAYQAPMAARLGVEVSF
jgi:hypothetical protein